MGSTPPAENIPQTMTLPSSNLIDTLWTKSLIGSNSYMDVYMVPSVYQSNFIFSLAKMNVGPVVIRPRNMLFRKYKSSNCMRFADKRLDGWGAGFRSNMTQTSRYCMTWHFLTESTSDLSRYSSWCVEVVLIDNIWIMRSTCLTWTSGIFRWVEWLGVIMQFQNCW